MATSERPPHFEHDLFDYWHLQYEGDLSLAEFMKLNADWSDMDYLYWKTTGELPHGRL
jgi:hypothetical protein